MVFLELRRRGNELFYFSEAHECDFVAKKDGIWSLYQVTYRLDNDNREWEIAGLAEAAMFLGLSNGTILTYEDEGQEQSGDVKIEVLPVRKWRRLWLLGGLFFVLSRKSAFNAFSTERWHIRGSGMME